MKQTRITLAVALLALSLAAGGARAQDAKLKQELQASYNQTASHIRSRNFKAFMTRYAPDYKDTPGELEGSEGFFKHLKSVKAAKLTVERAALKGKEAVARVHMTLDAIFSDPDGELGPKGKTHRMVAEVRRDDTLVKTAGGWKIKKSIDLPVPKISIDGKAMPMGGGK